jgi:regulator of sigma D
MKREEREKNSELYKHLLKIRDARTPMEVVDLIKNAGGIIDSYCGHIYVDIQELYHKQIYSQDIQEFYPELLDYECEYAFSAYEKISKIEEGKRKDVFDSCVNDIVKKYLEKHCNA